MHYTTAAEAVKLIRSNDSVYIQGSTSIPEALVAAMAERGGELEHVTVYSAFAVGAFDAPYCRPEYKESFLVNSLFVANNIRRWLADGYGQTIPAFLGEIPALFRDGTLPLDVALINVSPPDAEGYCSFGVSADLAVSAVECAKTIIAQVNKAMPYSYGDAVIHTSRLAAAVEVDSPLVEVPTAVPSETERKIGSYIAELIPDGATLQIGVGGRPFRPSWAKSPRCSATARCLSTSHSSTSRRPTPKATARSASRPIWRFPPWSAPRPSSRRSTRRCPTPTATP